MVVCATIVIAMQTITVLLKLPTKGRKKYFSRTTPRPPMASIEKAWPAQGLGRISPIIRSRYTHHHVDGPVAKLSIPSMLKRSAKPVAVRMYMAESMNTLIVVAIITCSIETPYSLCPGLDYPACRRGETQSAA